MPATGVSERDTKSVVEHLLITHGYLAVVVLAFIQASCIPLPSEVTFGFAGVLTHEGHMSLALVILFGTLAETMGSFIAYAIGRFGGRPVVERAGRYVLITPRDLDRAETWLDGRGEYAVAIGRAMPVIRLFSSVLAGMAEMQVAKFALFSLLGTAAYVSVLSSLGYAAASQWHRLVHDFALAGWVIAALVVVLAGLGLFLRIRELRRAGRVVS